MRLCRVRVSDTNERTWIVTKLVEHVDVLQEMEQYGGSFVRKLARAWYVADLEK